MFGHGIFLANLVGDRLKGKQPKVQGGWERDSHTNSSRADEMKAEQKFGG